jgi:HAD superfamily hydrolase (TIGR01549 family)
MISWVFFDLGGTLLDDSALVDAITRTYVELLNDRGYAVSLAEFVEVRDLVIARQEHPLFRSAATTFTRDAAVTDDVWSEVAPRVLGAEVMGQHAFPEAADVLGAASRHAGIGVIANQYRTVRDVLRRDGLDAFFRILQISEEAGVSKPRPGIFERALREAGCKPEEAVMVGDRIDFDVEPARALGFHTVRVKWGVFRNQSPLRAGQRPDAEVGSLSEVPAALDRLARRG